MASEAQKEPTMEEILASIRRIISEDDGGKEAGKPGKASVSTGAAPSPEEILGRSTAASGQAEELDDLDDFAPAGDAAAPETGTQTETETEVVAEDDLLSDLGIESLDDLDGEEAASVRSDAQTSPEPAVLETEEVNFDEDLSAGEDVDSVLRSISGAAFEDEVAAAVDSDVSAAVETALAETPIQPSQAEPTPSDAVPSVTAPHEETPTMTAAAQRDDTLTDDRAATAAAGAMAKLIGRMDLGGEQTLEGLVREMLKPMMKEWLDANLPRIVEAKVEAEVQRIARMAG